MAEVGLKFILEDDSLISGMDSIIKKYEDLIEAETGFNDSTKKTFPEAGKAAKGLGDDLAETAKKGQDFVKSQEAAEKQLTQNLKTFKLFGVSLQDIQNKYKEFTTSLRGSVSALGNVTKGTTGLTRAFKLLKVAIAATGIGLLVVALGSLVAFFKRTQEGADTLSRAMAGLRAGFEVILDVAEGLGQRLVNIFSDPKEAIKDLAEFLKTVLFDATIGRVQSLGTAIKLLFSGDFKGAAKEAVDVLSGVNNSVDRLVDTTQGAIEGTKALAEEMRNEARAARELEGAQQRLRDSQIALKVETSETRAEIAQLRQISRDQTKDFNERAEAARKAGELEQGLVQKRIELAKEEVQIIAAQNALSNNLVEDNQRLADAEAKVADIKFESTNLQIRLTQELNAITKQQQAEIKRLEDAYNSLTGTLNEQLAALDSELASPVERLQMENKAAIASLEELETQLIDSAIAAGKPIDGITESIERLKIQTNNKFRIQIEALATAEIKEIEVDDNIPTLEIGERDPLSITGKASFGDIEIEDDGFIAAVKDVFKNVSEIFSSDKLQGLLQGAGTFLNEFTGLFTENIDAQIAEIDRLQQKRREDIEALEEDLVDAEQLRKEGFDLNVENKQEQLDALLLQEEEDNKKRQELEKQKATAQLLQDSITQGSGLITASANIYKSFSALGPFGIGLAVAAITAMFASFAKIKIDAAKATALHEGSDRLWDDVGYFAQGESSDKHGRPSLRIVDDSGNTRALVGGDEMLVDGNTSLTHGAVMKWVKANKDFYTAGQMLGMLKGMDHVMIPSLAMPDLNIDRALSEKRITLENGRDKRDTRIQQAHGESVAIGVERAFAKALESGNDDLLQKYFKLKKKGEIKREQLPDGSVRVVERL